MKIIKYFLFLFSLLGLTEFANPVILELAFLKPFQEGATLENGGKFILYKYIARELLPDGTSNFRPFSIDTKDITPDFLSTNFPFITSESKLLKSQGCLAFILEYKDNQKPALVLEEKDGQRIKFNLGHEPGAEQCLLDGKIFEEFSITSLETLGQFLEKERQAAAAQRLAQQLRERAAAIEAKRAAEEAAARELIEAPLRAKRIEVSNGFLDQKNIHTSAIAREEEFERRKLSEIHQSLLDLKVRDGARRDAEFRRLAEEERVRKIGCQETLLLAKIEDTKTSLQDLQDRERQFQQEQDAKLREFRSAESSLAQMHDKIDELKRKIAEAEEIAIKLSELKGKTLVDFHRITAQVGATAEEVGSRRSTLAQQEDALKALAEAEAKARKDVLELRRVEKGITDEFRKKSLELTNRFRCEYFAKHPEEGFFDCPNCDPRRRAVIGKINVSLARATLFTDDNSEIHGALCPADRCEHKLTADDIFNRDAKHENGKWKLREPKAPKKLFTAETPIGTSGECVHCVKPLRFDPALHFIVNNGFGLVCKEDGPAYLAWMIRDGSFRLDKIKDFAIKVYPEEEAAINACGQTADVSAVVSGILIRRAVKEEARRAQAERFDESVALARRLAAQSETVSGGGRAGPAPRPADAGMEQWQCFNCRKTFSVSQQPRILPKLYPANPDSELNLTTPWCEDCVNGLPELRRISLGFGPKAETQERRCQRNGCANTTDLQLVQGKLRCLAHRAAGASAGPAPQAEKKSCVICEQEREARYVFTPCGHEAGCRECAEKSTGTCYVCKQVAGTMRVHLAR